MKSSNVKRLFCAVCALSLLLASLTACSATTADSDGGKTTDTMAKEMFENAVEEIITLASEDPVLLIKTILGDDVQVVCNEKNIDGVGYYETTAKYEELSGYYSEIFTGDALRWVLSTKFADVDETLYCSPAGGASGWGGTDVEVPIPLLKNPERCLP
ncbi:hypothetical protein FACS1894191_5660 [Clostridia bacterium]|nr:hypothetical protein FACS1894191_5660 [Clostridia bacterium]